MLITYSTVALEALAAGCKVIIPVFSDSMFMSPLGGFEEHYSKVDNPAELKTAVDRYIGHTKDEGFSDAKDFVFKYWCLDKSLKRWEEILR